MPPTAQSVALEWFKAISSVVISWPMVGLFAILVFRRPMLKIMGQFTTGDLRRIKVGELEIERELTKLAEQGQQAVSKLNRINELMAESRLLELEITQSMFGTIFSKEQQQRLKAQVEELRLLTQHEDDTVAIQTGSS